ncbi:MAG: hypothetical protein AB7S65_09740 [Sulfuricurvum sp.]
MCFSLAWAIADRADESSVARKTAITLAIFFRHAARRQGEKIGRILLKNHLILAVFKYPRFSSPFYHPISPIQIRFI